MIIGICGKLGTGKDYIKEHHIYPILDKLKVKYMNINFADQIKINAISKNNISYNDVYITKTAESRILLQKEGTEIGRSHDKNIWVNYLDNWIKVYKDRGINVFIISDCRFLNEFEYIKQKNGIIIKIIAPERNKSRLLQESNGDLEKYNQITNHCSECDLDSIPDIMYDYVIKNDINDKFDFNYLHHELNNKFFYSYRLERYIT